MKFFKNWIIFFGLLYNVPQPYEAATVKIAWMAVEPFTYLFNASTSRGALKNVIDEIEADPALLPGDTFDVQWKDSGCSSKKAVGGMFEYLENRASTFDFDFFLGPICSGAMAPVAQLASYLNIPVFGWISSDPPLADKTLYSTLVRFLWSINNIGEGIAILCRNANWKRVAIISTEGGDYDVLAEGVRDVLLQNSADQFVVQRWVSGLEEGPSQETIKSMYDLVKNEARIIIIVTPLGELRNWTKAAFDHGMAGGDYVFIYTNQQTPSEQMYNEITSRAFWEKGDSWDSDVQHAYENFILVFAKTLAFSTTNDKLAKFRTSSYTWTGLPAVPPAEPDIYSLFLYDAMKVYARFATSTGTTRNGITLFNAARTSITTGGATGNIILSDTCDRIPDYRFFDMGTSGAFVVAAETITTLSALNTINRDVTFVSDFIWGDGSTGFSNAPPDIPACGFDGELCKKTNYALYWAPPVVIVIVIGLILIIYFVHRKLKYEHDLNSLIWKLNYDDMSVYMGGKAPGSQMNLRTRSQHMLKSRASVADSLAGQQLYITVANYKGNMVAIRKVRKPQGIKMDRDLLQEMKRMNEMKHNNLNAFIGACTDPSKQICCVWEYCTKGSLQDVIYNESLTLDDMFKFSISIDMLKGLEYLHETSLKVHGQLKSSNIVIDNRWTCKLTDFGMVQFCDGEEPDPEQSDYAKYAKLLWTSPETLHEAMGEADDIDAITVTCRCPSNMGDVYSAGIIMKETFCRNSPYQEHEDDLGPKEIITNILKANGEEVFRPDLSDLANSIESKAISGKLHAFICQCWSEETKDRPTASHAVRALTKINPFKKANVVDNMMMMMEKYSNQLEEIVSERTLELQEEQQKTEDLLFKMLPKSVAQDLKHGKTVDAEAYDSVTIYFSDIPGFSELAAECTPLQVVDILNGLYSLMDETINNHDVYKVETVGDVYVLVSGLPIRNGDRHIVEVVNCSLDLISAILNFKVPHKPSAKLPLRIGINTGPIVTGVVGLTNPRYCLFGDTMNTASRMESNGKPLRIHMSPASCKALGQFSGYHMADRGEIPVKGKGMMGTFWLVGKDDYVSPLPNYRSELLKDQPQPQFLPPTSGKVANTKVSRPSTESGFSEMNMDSRKNSNISGVALTGAQRRTGTTELPLIEIDPATSYRSNGGLPVVDVTSPH